MDAASPVTIAPAASGWRRAATRLFRLAEWLVWAVFFVAALAFLLLRYAILPKVESYRPAIEAALSRGLGNKVSIGRIEAGWEGLHPDLDLADVRVYDAAGRTALTLPQVSVTVSWWTAVSGDLRLHALEIIEIGRAHV